MRFSNKTVIQAGLLFLGVGIGFISLANGDAIGQMSPSDSTNPSEMMKNIPSLENTAWQLIALGGTQPLTKKPITLSFNENGRLAGSSGCNRYFGGFSVQGNQLTIKSPLGSTKMACPETFMKQEQQFLQALTTAKKYKINAKGQLEIEYSDGKQTKLLIFTPEKTNNTKSMGKV